MPTTVVASASAVCEADSVTAPVAVTVVPTTAWTVLWTVALAINHDTVTPRRRRR